MKNNAIVLLSQSGRKDEGIILGAYLPGSLVEVDPSIAPVNGRLRYRLFTPGGDGLKGPFAILDFDPYQGFTPSTPYVAGKRCFLWHPAIGDEFNMLVGHSGTNLASCAIGDKFIANNGTGLLIPTTGSPTSQPFQAIEAITAGIIGTGSLVGCRFTGY